MHDQPIFVPTEVEDDAIVCDEVYRRAELSLHVRRATPPRLSRCGEPQADRPFSLRVTLPKLLESSTGDHLHSS
jgi:hypothetical protein